MEKDVKLNFVLLVPEKEHFFKILNGVLSGLLVFPHGYYRVKNLMLLDTSKENFRT